MAKVRFNPAVYEAFKHTRGKGVSVTPRAPAAEKVSSAPIPKPGAAQYEMEPAKVKLGGHPQLVVSLSATACYGLIFGLAVLLAIAFVLGRAGRKSQAPRPPEQARSTAPLPTLPLVPSSSPEVAIQPRTPVPTSPAPTAGPWRIRTFSGTRQEAERVADFLKSQGLAEVSVQQAGRYVAVFVGRFPTEQAARTSAEASKIVKLKLDAWTFTDAYPQKLE